MDLIKDINNTARERDAIETAIEETEPKSEETEKKVSDYLTDIKTEKTS